MTGFKRILEVITGGGLPLVEKTAQKWRFALQAAFTALTISIGFEFYYFTASLQEGGALSPRPPGVDGFLPISSLMSLRLLAISGEVHRAHPAGLFILLAIIAASFVIGKSFCGWLCPFGFLSELLYRARKFFSPSAKPPPAWLDYTLGVVKYLVLAFFSYIIFFAMNATALRAFLDGDYNKISDIRMFYFFARITPLAAFITGSIFLLSYFIPYFWCRYLCPYGALLGLFSLAGPVKIKRDSGSCTGCGHCAAVCPQRIAVDKASLVHSDECTSCALCLDACPAPGALELRLRGTPLRISTRYLPLVVAGIFCLITGLAMLSGNWKSEISADDYRRLMVGYDSVEHPR